MHENTHPQFLVVISRRSHPIPSRTRKLSSLEPMVLLGRPSGRVGRRQDLLWPAQRKLRGLFLFVLRSSCPPLSVPVQLGATPRWSARGHLRVPRAGEASVLRFIQALEVSPLRPRGARPSPGPVFVGPSGPHREREGASSWAGEVRRWRSGAVELGRAMDGRSRCSRAPAGRIVAGLFSPGRALLRYRCPWRRNG